MVKGLLFQQQNPFANKKKSKKPQQPKSEVKN